MSKRAAFATLGCKVNQYDTAAMMELFRSAGYELVAFDAEAEVYVVNTCTVTHEADRKSRQLLRRAKRRGPDSTVVAVGCYAQTAADELMEVRGVDLVLGNQEKDDIVEVVEKAGRTGNPRCRVSDIMKVRCYEQTPLNKFMGRTRAILKIQDGCSEYCSYCIIPFARGRERSRRPEEVLQEAHRLAEQGFKEVVLTGIQLSSYGRDLEETVCLAGIVEELHQLEGVERIRLSSLEPMGLTSAILERFSRLPRLCHQLHLPLQAGSDFVLERMRRNYTTTEFRELVEAARQFMPDVNITTDVMVGFPGESRWDFEKSLDFVRSMNFGRIHAFPYSRREGTSAFSLEDQVDPQEMNRRQKALLEVAAESRRRFDTRFLGEVVDVLVEGEAEVEGGLLSGWSGNYIRVLFAGGEDLAGKLVWVRLVEPRGEAVFGEAVGRSHGQPTATIG